MFTQPVSSPPPGPQILSPSSPPRPGRLRGLSALRNYTQNHILSRDHNANSGSNSGNTSPSHTGNDLTRSVSYDPPSSLQAQNGTNRNRLTLVGTNLDLSGLRSPALPQTPGARNPTSPQPTIAEDAAGSSTAAVAPAATTRGLTPKAPKEPRRASTGGEHFTVGKKASLAPQEPSVNRRVSIAGEQATMTRRVSVAGESGGESPESPPSIRLSAYYDPRSTRPSLTFSPVTRTLNNSADVIRVGRYSERDNHGVLNQNGHQPSAAPVGFKSKVVSRRHCEFWCEDGKWFIKDIKSSSGTFLNHIRLSPPSQESKAFPINDGDIVQLGIDFKGGEEMIFRCVKMRVELNRGWQNKLNSFNVAAHKRLRNMAEKSSSEPGSNSQDCSICLNSIAPCQSLFVAPCSHTWHYKCVKSLLDSPQYPVFICPNCRAGADLEADVDDPAEDWEQINEEDEEGVATNDDDAVSPTKKAPADVEEAEDAEGSNVHDSDAMDVTVNITPDSPIQASNATSEPMPIQSPNSGAVRPRSLLLREYRTPSPPGNGPEGPITPSNNAGPWVFDGGAGRRFDGAIPQMASLNEAADMDMNEQSNSEGSIQ